jgi:hypothetical protein
MGTWVPSWGYSGRRVKLTTHPRLVLISLNSVIQKALPFMAQAISEQQMTWRFTSCWTLHRTDWYSGRRKFTRSNIPEDLNSSLRASNICLTFAFSSCYCSFPMSTTVFLSSKNVQTVWGPPSLQFNVYRRSFPAVNRPERDDNHSPPPSADIQNVKRCVLSTPV